MALLDQKLSGPMEDETYADWARRRWGPSADAPVAAAPAPAEPAPTEPPPPPPATIPSPPAADDTLDRFKAAQAADLGDRKRVQAYARAMAAFGNKVNPALLGDVGQAQDVGQEIGMRQAIDMAPLKMRQMQAGASKAEADAALTGAKVPYAGQDAAADAAMKGAHAQLFGQQAAKGAADLEDTQAFRGALRNGDSTATALIRHLAKKYGGKDVSGAAGAEVYPLLPLLEKAYAAEQSAKARMIMAGASLAGSALTPEAIDMAAEYYRRTGNLPALGRDAQARAKIIARAAEIGQDRGSDIATNKANLHADQGSLASLQKNTDALNAFETTAGQNLDRFIAAAQAVVDKGSPYLNTPLRKLDEKLLGSPEMVAFNVARKVALTEIAKVLTNPSLAGQLSDSARHEVESLIGPDATLAQIHAAAKILRADMVSRRESYAAQIREIKGRIAGKPEVADDDKNADPLGIR